MVLAVHRDVGSGQEMVELIDNTVYYLTNLWYFLGYPFLMGIRRLYEI